VLLASSWPSPLRRALEFCLGDDFDPDEVTVECWERVFSAEESFRITYRGQRLYAVHHRPEDGSGAGMVQLYVRVLGGLWAINNLENIKPTVSVARRTATVCALIAIVMSLTLVIAGDQQFSVSVSF
jgi:hypothetical protein